MKWRHCVIEYNMRVYGRASRHESTQHSSAVYIITTNTSTNTNNYINVRSKADK